MLIERGLKHSAAKRLISSLRFSKEDEVMPAKFEDDLVWVAAGAPLADSAFLSDKIKDLCGDLPIFWLRPTYSTSKPSHSSVSVKARINAIVYRCPWCASACGKSSIRFHLSFKFFSSCHWPLKKRTAGRIWPPGP